MDQKLFLQNLKADLAEAGALMNAVSLDVVKLSSNVSLDGTPNLLANITQSLAIIEVSGSLTDAQLKTLPIQSTQR